MGQRWLMITQGGTQLNWWAEHKRSEIPCALSPKSCHHFERTPAGCSVSQGKRVTVWVNTSPRFSFQSALPSPTAARPIWICLKVPVQQNLMLLLLNSDCDQRWLAHRRTRTGAIWSVWGLFLEWMPVEQSGSLGVFLFYASNKTKELGMNNPSGRHLPGYF